MSDADVATFTEALADGASVCEAGRLIGLSGRQAYLLFDKVRDALGWQAWA